MLIFTSIVVIIGFVLMNIEVWLSLVERCVRDAKAAGSNPVTSTIFGTAVVDERSETKAVLYVCLYI